MATLNDAKRLARRVKQHTQASRLVEADLIAVANDDGVTSVKVTDSDTKNLVWAKLYGSDERIVQAYNTRVQPRDKAPVWLRQLSDGTYEIEGGRSRDGTELYGEAAGTVFLQELIGELMATVWAARNLKPGRARLSENGGLYIHIEPFFHNGEWIAPDDFDLTANIPATSDTHAWVALTYDPNGAALSAVTGTEHALAYTLNEDDNDGISLSPDHIPLAKIELFDSTTALDGSTRIVAWQNWITAPVSVEQYWPIEITDTRTLPANTQIMVRRQAVTGDGVLNVLGVLDVVD